MPFTITANQALKNSEQSPERTCHHCGEDCGSEPVLFADHNFCCQGCKMVYEILHANDLGEYYNIENNPGTSLKGKEREKYAWLDDPAIVEKLIDFADEKTTKITFHLPQIHCASCIWLLENLYKLNDGILQSKVNFLKKEAYLTFENESLTLRKVVELLAIIGYAPAINFSNLNDDEKPKVDRTFFYQLGVAGFAFGNIMLLSFPEYLGLEESSFKTTFGYLNILLALPVVFYSGRDYLKSAWTGLQKKILNIDVPISLGILALFSRSIFEIITQSGAGYLDSLAGLVFFLLIGKWFQQKTYHQLSFERDYKSYFPIAATILKNNAESSVALNQLNIGDTVIIRNKELIPADGILKNGQANIDYSFVTGESDPVKKEVNEKIFAGGRQIGQAIEVLLIKKVSQSYLTQLWNDDVFQKKEAASASTLSDKVGKRFTITILLVAFSTLFYWLSRDTGIAINAFTAVLIIACPCAIALSIPFTLGNLIRLFSRKDFYLKNTQVIENMAEIDTVVFDKTGTITETNKNELKYIGQELSAAEKIAVRSLAHQSTHPISQLIDLFFKNSELKEVLDFKEIIGHGTSGFSNNYFIEIIKAENGTAIKINGKEKGIFISSNFYRKGLNDLIKNWKNKYDCYILSGDNSNEKNNLEKLFSPDKIHFNQSPQDKLTFIKNLQTQNKKVLMIGDGLNDAGALQQSNVGIVVTENRNNFTPACDAILQADHFSKLSAFLQLSKKGIQIIYAAYFLALIYNVIGLSFAVQGILSPVIAAILMPLSSVTIVAFGVGMSSLAFRRFQSA
ncbi:MAG: heavy metal translocating P-type ATPase metal-binding domain-containing protein [Saprospiraceae bacterium]